MCYSVRCDFFSHLFKDLNTPLLSLSLSKGPLLSPVPLPLGPAPFPDQQALQSALLGMWPPKGAFLVPRPPGSGPGGKRMVRPTSNVASQFKDAAGWYYR